MRQVAVAAAGSVEARLVHAVGWWRAVGWPSQVARVQLGCLRVMRVRWCPSVWAGLLVRVLGSLLCQGRLALLPSLRQAAQAQLPPHLRLLHLALQLDPAVGQGLRPAR